MGRPPRFRNEIEIAVARRPWPETCIIFTGRRQPNGYGRVSENGTYVRAHVLACRLAHGERPPGKSDVAHSCGERMCINPLHLRWATRAENEHDKVLQGRSNRGGERSGAARLGLAEVREIRRRYANEHTTQQKLADEYGVHIMTVNSILNKRTWKHVD
jgi:hypothetical protein